MEIRVPQIKEELAEMIQPGPQDRNHERIMEQLAVISESVEQVIDVTTLQAMEWVARTSSARG